MRGQLRVAVGEDGKLRLGFMPPQPLGLQEGSRLASLTPGGGLAGI